MVIALRNHTAYGTFRSAPGSIGSEAGIYVTDEFGRPVTGLTTPRTSKSPSITGMPSSAGC
ncbi:MAG: hypothetical protein IPJ07_09180 [Acidobacteria bacterium]|nr:hypothetical protein [Acidobacteriota bacterium]